MFYIHFCLILQSTSVVLWVVGTEVTRCTNESGVQTRPADMLSELEDWLLFVT